MKIILQSRSGKELVPGGVEVAHEVRHLPQTAVVLTSILQPREALCLPM